MTTIMPFRYPGGKYYALPRLRPFWENIPHDEYREPFVGGGAVFFDKPKSYQNWINDIDNELITTYQVLSDQELRNRLFQELKDETPSKERWSYYYRDYVPTDNFSVAKKYYFLNRTSFSGKLISAAYGYRPKRSVPPSRWNEKIFPAGEKLDGVKISCLDFEHVITAPSSRETLIFVDPPYFGPTKKKHYRYGFERADHLRLCELLRESEHKFFLTYEDLDKVREIYAWANIHKLKFTYRVGDSSQINNKRQVGDELIISNYSIDKLVPEQYELLQS